VGNTEHVDWGCRQGGIDCKDKRQFGQGDGDSGKIAQKMDEKTFTSLSGKLWIAIFSRSMAVHGVLFSNFLSPFNLF
jgi:hypothetical protein